MTLRPIPEYCEHMTIEEFFENERTMMLGEDGGAYYATATECSDVPLLSLKEIIYREYPLMFTHVCWFNK